MKSQLKTHTLCKYYITIGTIVISLVGSSTAIASDLSIYKKGTAGQITLIMMLDDSGSMGSGSFNEDFGLSCTGTAETLTASAPSYSSNYCNVTSSTYSGLSAANKVHVTKGCTSTGTNTFKCLDRISRLKAGMYAALDSTNIPDTTYMGVGTFGSSSVGKILLEANQLGPVMSSGTGTTGQRYLLKKQIGALTTPYATPTGPAYAEAAAYLLGTTTVNNVNVPQDVYRLQTSPTTSSPYSTCKTLNSMGLNNPSSNILADTTTCGTWNSATTKPGTLPTSDSSYTYTSSGKSYTVYTKNVVTVDPNSGFSLSVSTSKNAALTAYQSPLPSKANRASCDGQGIYFLTDGEPNGPANDQSQVMKAALGSKGSVFNCIPTTNFTTYTDLNGKTVTSATPPVPLLGAPFGIDGTYDSSFNYTGNYVNDYPAWNCIGSFAQALIGNVKEFTNQKTGLTNVLGDGFTNPLYDSTLVDPVPKGAPIQSALVGFGSVFDNITTKPDPGNACAWGTRKGGSGDTVTTPDVCPSSAGKYGNGGFYHALSPADVTTSITQFIADLTVTDIKPLVTGAATIPVDGLNPITFQKYGYLRMLTPAPAATTQLLWTGNLKKFNVTGGALTASGGGTNFVLDATGKFVAGTTDLWNAAGASGGDGGKTDQGGANSHTLLTLPTTTNSTTTQGKSRIIRPLFTNFVDGTANEIVPAISSSDANCMLTSANSKMTNCGTALLAAPVSATAAPGVTDEAYIRNQFLNGATHLGSIPLAERLTLLNYLGYNVPLSNTNVPDLTVTPQLSKTALLAGGGIIHSMPIQLSYSGSYDPTTGALGNSRVESVLYGTQEGALHLVTAGNGDQSLTTDTTGGVEQMVFVPKEILDNTLASQALITNATGSDPSPLPSPPTGSPQSTTIKQVPSLGVDGPWVVDSSYFLDRSSTTLSASKMNVYGGLRMGGSSYYALNLLSPTAPRMLFRIGWDQSGKGFDRMGQTWSKPILANVRYNGAITRVMIVGGGYDVCYEDQYFAVKSTLTTTTTPAISDAKCVGKTQAAGNAVYMVNAITGQLIWEASNVAPTGGIPTGATATYNKNIVNSIVGRISTLDRDADGLIDHLYFADLGGQVFRADFNNASQRTTGVQSKFGVRVVRLANLATAVTANNPRFYEAPTVTIHDQGATTFIVVGVASGDRSSPLDVLPIASGGNGKTGAVVNNVYGIIDRDFINTDLITNTCYYGGDNTQASDCGTPTNTAKPTALKTVDIPIANLQKNPQNLSGTIPTTFVPYVAGTTKDGWYRSLSSNNLGTELSGHTAGGMKAFEEPLAITGNLLVPVYDPEGIATATTNNCDAKVVGESVRERFCLPYGVCLNSDGTKNTTRESTTGAQVNTAALYPSLIGPGIVGIIMGPDDGTGLKLIGNTSGVGAWSTSRKLIPTRWYEKQPNPNLVK